MVIDSFKREICGSLEDYNTKIENLRKEMEDYTLSTEAVQVCSPLREKCFLPLSCYFFVVIFRQAVMRSAADFNAAVANENYLP